MLRFMAALVSLSGMLALAPEADADAVYTYTGPAFDTYSGGVMCPSICSIDGSFTLPFPLIAGSTTDINPSAFDFYVSNAGTPSWTNANGAYAACGPDCFSVTTDSSDQIVSWLIYLDLPGVYPSVYSSSSIPQDSAIFGSQKYALSDSEPGTWTDPVPEPSSVWLMLTGLMAIALIHVLRIEVGFLPQWLNGVILTSVDIKSLRYRHGLQSIYRKTPGEC